MILQIVDLQRFILIYVAQSIVILFFLIIAIKILRRNRNQLTYALSAFYITIITGLLINAIYIPIRRNPIVYILHFVTIFCILFAFFFLVLFNVFLYKMETGTSRKKVGFLLILYIVLTLIIISTPNGFMINEQTDWKPIWTWTFLVIVYLYLFTFAFFPFGFLFIKIYRSFEEKHLRRRLKFFFIGFIGMIIAMLGGMLYNAWDSALFRTIWTFLAVLIALPSGILIYYGIAQKL